MDLFKNINELVINRAKEHVREGNVELANKYIDQLGDMLNSAIDYITILESTKGD